MAHVFTAHRSVFRVEGRLDPRHPVQGKVRTGSPAPIRV